MTVNKKIIYSSVKVTEEEQDFCKALFEMAQDVANERCIETEETLYEIVKDLKNGHGYIDFNDWV